MNIISYNFPSNICHFAKSVRLVETPTTPVVLLNSIKSIKSLTLKESKEKG